jgi:two-component system, chemotaxis family, CheB/CheR fusion protein
MQEFPNQRRAETQSSTSHCQASSHQAVAGYRSAGIATGVSTIFVVDDDAAIRATIRDLLKNHDYAVACFADGPAFLRACQAGSHGCLLIDALVPGMSGIALLGQMRARGIDVPVIMMSGNPSLHMAVQAMKAGAVDFIKKPFTSELLLASVKTALEQAEALFTLTDFHKTAARRVRSLTRRQHEILDLVVAGHPTKHIAGDLGISQRTVDSHRAAIARKTCSKSIPALIRTALCSSCSLLTRSDGHLTYASPNSRAGESNVLQ